MNVEIILNKKKSHPRSVNAERKYYLSMLSAKFQKNPDSVNERRIRHFNLKLVKLG